MNPLVKYCTTIGMAVMAFVLLVASVFVDVSETAPMTLSGLVLLCAIPIFFFLEREIGKSYRPAK